MQKSDFVIDKTLVKRYMQLNLPKTEPDRSGIFFSVFTGFRFTKGLCFNKNKVQKI
jgi:hypothetical protein